MSKNLYRIKKVDYKKDKRIRERQKERISQLYQVVPNDIYNAQNGHFPNNYKQINYGPSLHVPNSKSLDPSPRSSPRGSEDYQRYRVRDAVRFLTKYVGKKADIL